MPLSARAAAGALRARARQVPRARSLAGSHDNGRHDDGAGRHDDARAALAAALEAAPTSAAADEARAALVIHSFYFCYCYY